MQGELSRIYYEYYRFALDTARKAEQAMKQELMRPELDATEFVHFNYWDGGRRGLLAGDALQLDVKRLELAYLDNDRRELELVRHVSLRQLDPLALIDFRVSGRCEVSIPEWLFDRDCPGHYLRRLKTVAVSIPSVVGPYASVNCTLSLLRSTVRRSPLTDGRAYERDANGTDDRFVDFFGGVQSVVTSEGSNDSGLFETNLRDERFLPFEGAGAVSTWRLELPAQYRAFDYTTIADVVLHIRYTARDGGPSLADAAAAALTRALQAADVSRLTLFFSLPHDFPMEWAAFTGGTADLMLAMRREYFPYSVQASTLKIASIDLYGIRNGAPVRRTLAVPGDFEANLDAGLPAPLTVAPDADVLARDAAQLFLTVSYSL
jgi:hypothetical protein